jgi:hypothetical protein
MTSLLLNKKRRICFAFNICMSDSVIILYESLLARCMKLVSLQEEIMTSMPCSSTVNLRAVLRLNVSKTEIKKRGVF